MAILNEKLLKQQKVTDKQKENLYKLYKELQMLFEQAKTLEPYEKEQHRTLALELENLEYELQDNWNFPRSKAHHTYWNQLHGCECAYIDNKERFGINEKIITLSCPYHGIE